VNEVVGEIRHIDEQGVVHATETCYDTDDEDTQAVPLHKGCIVIRRTACRIPITYLKATEGGAKSVGRVERTLKPVTCLACMGAT